MMKGIMRGDKMQKTKNRKLTPNQCPEYTIKIGRDVGTCDLRGHDCLVECGYTCAILDDWAAMLEESDQDG